MMQKFARAQNWLAHIIQALQRHVSDTVGNGALSDAPLLWWGASVALLLLSLLLLLGSGVWSVRIASARNRPEYRHFAGGILLPLVYPISLLLLLKRRETADDDIGSPVRPRTEFTQPRTQPKKIEFPEHLKHRPIGRREDEGLNFSAADNSGNPKDFAAYRTYFEKLMTRAERSRRRQLAFIISYNGDSVVAERIVEILQTAVVIEYQRPDDATRQCIQIPFAKIDRCRVERVRS